MGKISIHLVEDDDELRASIAQTLKKHDFEVFESANADEAMDKHKLQKFDVVLSDIVMPGSDKNGLDLLADIKAESSIPVILMTGYSRELYEENSSAKGAIALLSKPFREETLISTLASILKTNEANQKSTEEFCRIPIDDFVSGQNIKYDVFVQLSPSKYIRVANQNETISLDRIVRYKDKGMEYLYLRKEDFKNYMAFMLGLSSLAKQSKAVSKEKYQHLIRSTNEAVAEHLYSQEIDRSSFDMAAKAVEQTVQAISEDDQCFALLEQINSHSSFLMRHSVGVSIYATMIARAAKWDNPKLLGRVGMAGLFHDIGKKELPLDLLEKPRNQRTQSEVKLYESHVIRGIAILSEIRGFPEDVLQSVGQHHEDLIGTGYPNRLPKAKTIPLSQLIAVADAFVTMIVTVDVNDRINPREAFNRLKMFNAETLNIQFVNALQLVIK